MALVGLQAPAVQRVLLHGRDDETPVRRPDDVEMRALSVQKFGLCIGVRKPERRAVVMSESEAIPLRRESEAAHGRGRLERLFAALVVARRDALAPAEGEAAAGVHGEGIDPTLRLG